MSGLVAAVLGAALLSGCQSSPSATGTPIERPTATAIPTLIIVTPTPAAPGKPGAAATSVPAAATATANQATNGQNGTYTVQPGDTLYTIAVRFNVTVQALMKANSITDPASLQAGQTIVIP